MDEWKKIKIEGIAGIEKCVAEFHVRELYKIPHGRNFKVRVFEDEATFTGFTNVVVKDKEEGGVGYGLSIEEALENTLINFMEVLDQRAEFVESDFEWADPDDF